MAAQLGGGTGAGQVEHPVGEGQGLGVQFGTHPPKASPPVVGLPGSAGALERVIYVPAFGIPY
ncbi:hypothetical protein GCM10012279_54990 [Micromonospora yangpuensis]|nr:hypothetical protein GCM10012279_54990 [Micromonospora yangpuensis]